MRSVRFDAGVSQWRLRKTIHKHRLPYGRGSEADGRKDGAEPRPLRESVLFKQAGYKGADAPAKTLLGIFRRQ